MRSWLGLQLVYDPANATLRPHHRTMEKAALAKLCAVPPVMEWVKSTEPRARRQKRAQRSVMLVDVLREQMLRWVPRISVS